MSRTVIVTPFGLPQQLAAACKLNNLVGYVVPVGDFSALVLDSVTAGEGERSAQAISQLAGKHEVLLLTRADEQIDAGHYRYGKRESDVPAGLALNNLPSITEQLLLETADPRTTEGSIDVAKMTKLQASAATMTPERAALARTALMWMVVAAVAFIGIVTGAIAALNIDPIVWAAVGLAAVAFAFSLFRINRLLAGKAAGPGAGKAAGTQ